MLEFMFTDRVPDEEERPDPSAFLGLFTVAQYIDCPAMQGACEQELSQRFLADETVCELWACAEQNRLNDLNDDCLHYFCSHFGTITYDPERTGFNDLPESLLFRALSVGWIDESAELMQGRIVKWAQAQANATLCCGDIMSDGNADELDVPDGGDPVDESPPEGEPLDEETLKARAPKLVVKA